MVKQEYDTDFDNVALKFCELHKSGKFPSIFYSDDLEKNANITANAADTVFAKNWQKFCNNEVFPNVESVPDSNLQHRARLALTGSMFGPDVGSVIEFIELAKLVMVREVELVTLEERLAQLSKWVNQRKKSIE
jgi:hypothetical protein